MENKELDIKNLEFLVTKSRDLIQEQLKSYESAYNKAGILISISSLLIPIAITFISTSNTVFIIKIFTIIPTALMIIALIYLLKVLKPKGLDHGFNFKQFDKQLDKSYTDLLLYEIGANRDSYDDNTPIVIRQNRNFKTGISLIFISAILLFILVSTSLFVTQKDANLSKHENIEQLDINNLTINKMSTNSNNDSSSNNQNNQNQQSSEESSRIPSVPREDRANLDKGEDSEPLIKK